jgi:glutamine amidotransferase
MIAIVDYDVGNVGAVANMLKKLGHASVVTSNPSDIRNASHLILPGNGSFDACMTNLRDSGLIPLIEERVHRHGTPLLGICVGAQILGSGSMEGDQAGLSWIDMVSVRFSDELNLPVPNMGWAHVTCGTAGQELTKSFNKNTRFYFVHSYHLVPRDKENVMLWARYGVPFAAGVAYRNIYGVQFHPEKSHSHGKILLDAFARLDL